MADPPRVEIQGLAKRYPRNRDLLRFLRNPRRREWTTALERVDLRIERGGIVALLGPNGAGKTTLLKVLAGLLLANAGRIRIDGDDLTDRPSALRERVGFAVCDERSFFWRISGRENLRFFATLDGFRGSDRADRVAHCLELVGLRGVEDRRYMEYSSGMRQKLALARGLLLEPSILLMDEPTRSLDPEATMRMHEVVHAIRAADPRRVILYSTHDLAEAESISSDVIVLRGGRVVAQQQLGLDDGTFVYRLSTHPPLAETALDDLRGVQVLGSDADAVVVRLDSLDDLDAALDGLRGQGYRVREVVQKRSSLRDVYLASAHPETAP